jgi:SAM-dependent methyltransferase
MGNMVARASRERDQYNAGLNRLRINMLSRHWEAYSDWKEDFKSALSYGHCKTVLEIGSYSWVKWLAGNSIVPRKLCLINISQAELDKSRIAYTEKCTIRPVFNLMDAHKLAFRESTFDIVYGVAILHHLDLEVAVQEIQRVLKPGGRLAFVEPLGINPVSKIVRWLTPNARTRDEQPFRRRELKIVRKYFDCEIYPQELLSVPMGLISALFFENPENWVTYMAHRFDTTLLKLFPPIGLLCRQLLVKGVNKKTI